MAVFIFALIQIKKWKNNIRIGMAFLVLVLLCVTMTGEYVDYSKEIGLPIQLCEPFILMFTQKYALILIMLIFLLVYQDIPFVDEGTPYQLLRGNRLSWAVGQLIYIVFSTFILLSVALLSCMVSGFAVAYVDNIWSNTSLFTAYGGALNQSAPISMNLLEYTSPYQAVGWIFLLFFLGALTLNILLFALHLWKGKYIGLAVVAGLIFIGYLVTADLLLGEWSTWISITDHTNLGSHRFVDSGTQPRVLDSVIFLLVCIPVSFLWVWRLSKKYDYYMKEKGA